MLFDQTLNQRNKIVVKNLNKILENQKMDQLISDKKGLNETKGLSLLNEENQSLNACLKISEDLNKIGMKSEDELQIQQKTLNSTLEKVTKIINKIPGIHKILSSIKFHKYKEKIILGLVIGCIVFLGLYLTYY